MPREPLFPDSVNFPVVLRAGPAILLPVMRAALLLFVLSGLFWPQPAAAAGKKPQEGTITFHIEGTGSDHPKMVFRVPESNRVFQRLASISTEDVGSFQAFPSDDGNYGAVFHLRKRGANRLGALSTAAKGRYLLAAANGRPVNVVLIDKPVTDGRLVVWHGLARSDVLRLDLALPRVGEDKKAWKLRKQKARAELKK